MFRLFLVLALLLGPARCDFQLNEIEASETPQEAREVFAVVDMESAGNDRVVAYVKRISGGLPRRFGLGQGLAGPGLLGFRSFMSIPDQFMAQVEQARLEMLQRRAHMMRMIYGDDFELLNRRLGARLAEVFLGQRGGGEPQGWPSGGKQGNPGTTAAARQSQQDAPQGAPMPFVPDQLVDAEPINWSFHNRNGSVNLGLMVFVLLASCCVAVWVHGVLSKLPCCRRMLKPRGQCKHCAHKVDPSLVALLIPDSRKCACDHQDCSWAKGGLAPA